MTAGLSCGLGCTPALSVTTASLRRHATIAALLKLPLPLSLLFISDVMFSVTDSSAEVAPAAAKLQSPKVLCVNELYDFFSRAIKHGGMTHNGLCTGHIRKLSGGRTILRRREDILKALSPHKCYSTCHEMDSIYASSAPNSI